MAELRFDGRTAIVTGAGGDPSLGRAYALLLASRGANVVVNDVNAVPESTGYVGVASAEAVAEEITALGGRAVADTHSVATPQGAAAIVETALSAFGGVDILVNNAAVGVMTRFDRLTDRDHVRHVEVNLLGVTWMCRAVWPHMIGQGYGRIVNIGSGAMAGMAFHVAYGATKGGVWALSRALAGEGVPHGIKVNVVNPFARTRMTNSTMIDESQVSRLAVAMAPEKVAPVVAYLVHEDCPVTGECFAAAGGGVKRVLMSQTEGIIDPDLTIESLARAWDRVMDPQSATILPTAAAPTREDELRPYRPLSMS
jgi:NAD(P)-dependent dehydrogenase (short-subunit alcohol dehydrogenase family)